MNKDTWLTLIGSALLALALVPAQAEIYKWTDADGTVHYGDRPASGAKPARLPGLQKLDQIEAGRSTGNSNAESSAQGLVPTLRITSPQPEQTFRDAQGNVSVQVEAKPQLPPGARIMYYLDGQPISSEPTLSTSVQLEGVLRGAHTLSAAVMAGNREIARAAPVVFFMKQQSALNPLQSADGSGGSTAPTAPPTTRAGGVLGAPSAAGP